MEWKSFFSPSEISRKIKKYQIFRFQVSFWSIYGRAPLSCPDQITSNLLKAINITKKLFFKKRITGYWWMTLFGIVYTGIHTVRHYYGYLHTNKSMKSLHFDTWYPNSEDAYSSLSRLSLFDVSVNQRNTQTSIVNRRKQKSSKTRKQPNVFFCLNKAVSFINLRQIHTEQATNWCWNGTFTADKGY